MRSLRHDCARRDAPEAFELLATVEMEYKDYHREVLWDSGPGGDTHSDGTAFGGTGGAACRAPLKRVSRPGVSPAGKSAARVGGGRHRHPAPGPAGRQAPR